MDHLKSLLPVEDEERRPEGDRAGHLPLTQLLLFGSGKEVFPFRSQRSWVTLIYIKTRLILKKKFSCVLIQCLTSENLGVSSCIGLFPMTSD